MIYKNVEYKEKKGELEKLVKLIKSQKEGQVSGEELEILKSIYGDHIFWVEKILAFGKCIYHLRKTDDMWGGDLQPFNYKKGIDIYLKKDNYKKLYFNDIIKCCRNIIRADIDRSRSVPGLEAHHEGVTFNYILKSWIKRRLKIKDIKGLKKLHSRIINKDNRLIFNDDRLNNSFKKYHDSIANIVFLTTEEHKKKHSKNDI